MASRLCSQSPPRAKPLLWAHTVGSRCPVQSLHSSHMYLFPRGMYTLFPTHTMPFHWTIQYNFSFCHHLLQEGRNPSNHLSITLLIYLPHCADHSITDCGWFTTQLPAPERTRCHARVLSRPPVAPQPSLLYTTPDRVKLNQQTVNARKDRHLSEE